MPDEFSLECGEFAELVQYKCWKEAFVNGRQILDHTRSHKRMSVWIEALVKVLRHMGRESELPRHFDDMSLLARKDVLDRLEVKFR